MNVNGGMPQNSPGSAPGVAPGRLLAQARELQNLSTTDIARQLKLSLWQVEALEAGRYDRLPGTVFVRGFIRNYARLVKLDPEALLQSTGDRLPQTVPQAEAPPSQDIPYPTAESRRGPVYLLTAVLIVGALAFYEFYWNEPETVAARRAPEAPAPVAALDQPPQPQASPAQPRDPVPAEVETGSEKRSQAGEKRASRPATSAAPAATPDPAPAPTTGVPREPEPSPRAGERQVKLEFDEESWVEIIDGTGRAIFSQLNLAGTVRRVRGLPPLTVVVGNARGVKLTYDDRPIDLARHTKIDVARLTLE